MTVLVFGLDGLDFKYVKSRGLLEELEPNLLHQDLDGWNGIYTFRVWPAIFASEDAPDNRGSYDSWHPGEPYIWEEVPAAVMLAPITLEDDKRDRRHWSGGHQDEFPEEWLENTRPRERIDESLSRLRRGVLDCIARDVPLVIAVTRTCDMVQHRWSYEDPSPQYIERACDLAVDLADEADEYMILSDHGFEPGVEHRRGKDGVREHSRRATFTSSFADFETMSDLVAGFKDTIHEEVNREQLEALGYL